MGWARGVGGAVCVVACLLGRPARAADLETPRFRLAYEAGPTCPDRKAFLEAIRARTARPRLVEDETEPAIILRVVVTTEGERTSGRLELREPDGTEEIRHVESRTCSEVTKALALVAAVMLDPDASTAPEPVPVPEPIPAPPPPPPPPPPSAPPPPPPPERPSLHWFAGIGVGAAGGIGPALAPAGDAFVEVERTYRGLASALRLGVEGARTSSDLRGGTQTYEWVAAALRLRPLKVDLSSHAFLAPWAGFQVGGHRGTTRDVRSPSSSTALWLAPTVGGTIGWELGAHVTLELQGGAVFPLRRTRYWLAPDSTIFEVPVVSAAGSLGVRIRFL
jgi:hypothetical protein